MEPKAPPSYVSCIAQNYNKTESEDLQPDFCSASAVDTADTDFGYPDIIQQGVSTAMLAAQPYANPEVKLSVADNFPSVQLQMNSVELVSEQQSPLRTADNCSPPSVQLGTYTTGSYYGHMALACFIAGCCSLAFGVAAFELARSAEVEKVKNPAEARKTGADSLRVSILGLVTGLIFIPICLYFNVLYKPYIA